MTAICRFATERWLQCLQTAKFFAKEGIDASGLVCAKQSHGNTVAVVTEADAGKGAFDAESAIPGVDALITNRRKVPLAVFTADCLPVFCMTRNSRL